MVAQLEIGLHQFLEHHHRVVVPLLEALKKVFHKHPILLVRSIRTQNASDDAGDAPFFGSTLIYSIEERTFVLVRRNISHGSHSGTASSEHQDFRVGA